MQHAVERGLHLRRIERLADERHRSVFVRDQRQLRVACQEDEGDVPLRQDAANGKAKPTPDVYIEDGTIYRFIPGEAYGVVEVAGWTREAETALGDEIANDLREQVIVLDD
jgi:hypothetical protein